jgi:hypothetical protein
MDATPAPFTMLGDQAASVCVDDVCELAEHIPHGE